MRVDDGKRIEEVFEHSVGGIKILAKGGNPIITDPKTGKKKRIQKPQMKHGDFGMEAAPGVNNHKCLPEYMPCTLHIPLTSAGSHIYVEVKGQMKLFNIKFGEALLLRGDVQHQGGVYKFNGCEHFRLHVYFNAIDYLESDHIHPL